MSTMETIEAAPVEAWGGNPVSKALLAQTHAALAQASQHTDRAAQLLLAANEAMSESLTLMGRESLSFSVGHLRQRIDDTRALMQTGNLGTAAGLSAAQTTAALQTWAEATRRLSGHWTSVASAYLTLTVHLWDRQNP